MRNNRLDRQLESQENVTIEIPLSAIANSTKDIIEFSHQLTEIYKQYSDQADSAAAACGKNGAYQEMAQIESEKRNITKSVNLLLGRCHNYLQKAGSVYVVSDTDGRIFNDLDSLELSNDTVTSKTNNESSASHLLRATDHSGKHFSHLENYQSEYCVTSTLTNSFFSTNAQNVIPSAVSSPTSVLSFSQGITYSNFPSISTSGNVLSTSKPICHNVNYQSNALPLSSQSSFFPITSNLNTSFFGTGRQPHSSRINEPQLSFQRTSNTVPLSLRLYLPSLSLYFRIITVK